MNSCLQQLFFVANFRETLLRIKKEEKDSITETSLYQLQHLYSALKHSDKQYVNPKGFCKVFKD